MKKPTTKVSVQKLPVLKGHRVPNATVPSTGRTTTTSSYRRGTEAGSWRRGK
jgi:hypothetical protein